MSTYTVIVGKYVRSVAEDPDADESEGEIWYNTDSNTFKTSDGSSITTLATS